MVAETNKDSFISQNKGVQKLVTTNVGLATQCNYQGPDVQSFPPTISSTLCTLLFIFIMITGHKCLQKLQAAYLHIIKEKKKGHRPKCPLYQGKQKGFPKASRTNISLAGTGFHIHPSCRCSWKSECVAPSLPGEAERRKKLAVGFASQCFAYHWFPPQHICK